MLQTLLYIPCEVAGWPVFGFGLLLAAWGIISVAMLARVVRRQGFNADTWGYLPMVLVVGAVIAWVLPALCEPRGLPIRGYGAMILLAVICSMALAMWRAWRAAIQPEILLSLAFWMILPGIIGARSIYVTEYWSREYWPVYQVHGLWGLAGAIVNVANGGLVVYGAFFGGVVGFLLFCWKYRLPLLAMADLIAPSLLLGLALGRVGCLLNGCCFGGPCDLPWKVEFPWNSPVHLHQTFDQETPLLGLTLEDGPDGRPQITEIEAGSPAERAGLMPKQTINRINGMAVGTAKDADWAILNLGKLHLSVQGDAGPPIVWIVDNPSPASSPSESDWPGYLRIFGLKLAGGRQDAPVIAKVRSPSAEKAFGLRSGMRIEKLNGRPVKTIGQLDDLIREHAAKPWLTVEIAGVVPGVEVPVPQPLPRSMPVHPTQVYSTIDALILCLLLLACQPFFRRDGAVTALMMTVYPITRFLIEDLRMDEANIFGTGMHISQNISLGVFVFAVGLWIFIFRRPPVRAFEKPAH